MKYKIFWQIASLFLLVTVATTLYASIVQCMYTFTSVDMTSNFYAWFYIGALIVLWVFMIALCGWALRNGFSRHVPYPDDNTGESFDYHTFTAVMLSILGAYLFVTHISLLISTITTTIQFWGYGNSVPREQNVGDLFLNNVAQWVTLVCAVVLMFQSRPIAQVLVKRACCRE